MAKEFSKDNYINVPGFAIVDLKLSGNELLAFSIIHGFSQDNSSEYNGSLSYMATALNTSRQTVINTLKSLTDKGLITKKETFINGVKFNSYKFNKVGSQNFVPPVKNISKVVKKLDGGSQNFVPNNIFNNKDNNITNNIKNVTNVTFPEKFVELYNLYDGSKKDIGTEYDKWIEKCKWNVDYDLLLKRLKKDNKQPFQSWLNKFRTEPSKFPKIIIEEYQIFHEKQTGVIKSDFKAQEIVSLDNISKQIESAVKSKLGGLNQDLESNVRQSIQLIFNNWNLLESFYQKQIKPNQIDSNLSVIFKQIKDGLSKSNNKIGRISVEDFNNIGSTIDFEKYNNY